MSRRRRRRITCSYSRVAQIETSRQEFIMAIIINTYILIYIAIGSRSGCVRTRRLTTHNSVVVFAAKSILRFVPFQELIANYILW